MYLLGVVVGEFLDVNLDGAAFGQDRVGGGGPCGWFSAGVPVCDVVAYLFDQDLDATEGAATDVLAGDDAKPDFVLLIQDEPTG